MALTVSSQPVAPDLYRTVVDTLDNGILLVDGEGTVLAANQRAEQILGFDIEHVCGGSSVPWRFVDGRGVPVPPEELPCQRGLRTGVEQREVVLGVARADGSFAWVEFNARPTTSAGVPVAVLSFADVTERHRQRTPGDGDTLTGAFNRRSFEDQLRQQVNRCRMRGETASLLLVDIDGLKAINDAFGHATGDAVLVDAARRLRSGLRDSDVLARCGGDEFAVLLQGAGEDHATEIAVRLAAALAEPRTLDAPTPVASIGICVLDDRTTAAESALAAADAALYEAKQSGPGGVSAAPIPDARGRHRPQRSAALVFERLGEPGDGMSVERIVTAARDLLEMDIAYSTEMTTTEQVFETVVGDGDSFGVGAGTRMPLEMTYCERILSGRLPNLMPDLSVIPEAAAMPVTEAAGVGAYVSVPITLPDGRRHGTLCLAAHEARPDISERDVRYLHLLARLLGDSLERERRLIERAASTGLRALAAAVETRDQYTSEHSEIVLELVGAVARQMGLSATEVAVAEQVGLLHDLGKLAVPDAILHKPGPLDDDEWEVMRGHPEAGARLVAAIPELGHLADAIRAEHERWDGRGYPFGLAGESIPAASRIVFVCDAYHAMTSDRPYRASLPRDAALQEITANAGTQFCPVAAQALVTQLA